MQISTSECREKLPFSILGEAEIEPSEISTAWLKRLFAYPENQTKSFCEIPLSDFADGGLH